MKQLYIHIGLHKTGTTAIQHFLHTNRTALEAAGYLYPGKEIAQHAIGWMFNEIHPSHRNLVRECHELFEEVKNSDCDKIVLSSETISAYKRANAPKLKQYLDLELDSEWSAKIIVYLRRQDHWLESRYMENIRTDYSLSSKYLKEYTFSEFLANYRQYYELDYYQRLQSWKEVFGLENIVVRAYEKLQWQGDITQDFLQAIGITRYDKFANPKKFIHTSLSPDAIELIRLYNKYFNLGRRCRRVILDVLTRISSKTPFSSPSYLSPKERFLLLREYREANKKVAVEYLGRADGRLFYEECPDPDVK
jgi:hypothetical protein